MLKRLSFAFIGASLITGTLILGMSEVAKLFERPDSEIYMRVMDFIPGTDHRQLPDKRMPRAQPERARVDLDVVDTPREAVPPTFDERAQSIDVSVDLDPVPADAR